MRFFFVCMLIFCVSTSIGQSACADIMAVQEKNDFDYASEFVPELVHKLEPVACSITTISGFVMDTDQPTIAHCGGQNITITGIAKSRKKTNDAETTHVLVKLDRWQKKSVAASIRLNDFPAVFIDSVEFADLNGDGENDFILDLSSHGNGLAAEIGGTLFLLSSLNGYSYLGISEVMKAGSRYVRFGKGRSAVFVLQRLATDQGGSHSVRGLDRKSHTFFVFDLLQFDVACAKGVRLNNRLDPRFPIWTRYTNQSAHPETDRLTQHRKRILWRDPLVSLVHGKLLEDR